MTLININKFNSSFFVPARFVLKKARKVVVPGMDGATLFDFIKFFLIELRTVRLTERAAAVTYNFLMAMPPTFLFLFSLVPYLPLKNVHQTIFATLKLLTPNQKIYLNVSGVVRDFLEKPHQNALSTGLLMVLFFSSNGMVGLMKSFDKSEALYKKRNAFQRRWTAIKLTVMLIIVSMLTLSVLILQNKSLNKVVLAIFPDLLAVKILSIIILIPVIFVTFCLIYTYGPSLTHRFKFVTPGSIFATIVSLLSTSVFYFLVNNFLNYNKVYGSIGTLIAFMVFIWLNTVIILLGYELNVSILLGKLKQAKANEYKV